MSTWIESLVLIALLAAPTVAIAETGESKSAPGFRIGVESIIPGTDDWFASIYGTWFGKYFTEQQLGEALREVGAGFTLFYDSIAPKKKEGCRRATDMCKRLGMPYLFNNTYGDILGPWIPGTGRAEYKKQDIAYALQSGLFKGVIWDEVEHRQLHWIDKGEGPYYVDAAGLTPEQCHHKLVEAIRAACYHNQGSQDVAEFVFPSMFHIFAEAGMIPAPKVCKESYNPIMMAIAMGAALQYDRELWAVADLWGLVPFWGALHRDAHHANPAHSPDEFVSSLMTAYWMGADAVYTEALYDLITPISTTPEEWKELEENPFTHRGPDNPLVLGMRKRGYILTVYGKYHRIFAKDYVPKHPRPYSFRDVRPEVAIVLFPDSAWCKPGAAPGWSSDKRLFSPKGPEKQARHGAIFDIWHLLTHRKVPHQGISFYNEPHATAWSEFAKQAESNPDEYPFNDPHSGFCPLNGVVVFDHQVKLDLLRGIPLIICSGETISSETQKAIDSCVRQGAKCLTLQHLLDRFAGQATVAEPRLVKAGKGSYLIARDFTSRAVADYIKPHLGPDDEVRYTFGRHTVCLKPFGGDERRLTASLEPAK